VGRKQITDMIHRANQRESLRRCRIWEMEGSSTSRDRLQLPEIMNKFRLMLHSRKRSEEMGHSKYRKKHLWHL